MSTNNYFNNFSQQSEQTLIDNLIVESIQIYGQNMYYVARNINKLDKLYTEDTLSTYTNAYLLEFYIANISGFTGDRNFMSKFGVEIRDQIVFQVARTTFGRHVTQTTPSITRPREGDLIYFPLNKKCFEIKFVEDKSNFYPLGVLPVYDLTCELFEYSSERFDTGVTEIDEISTKFSMDIFSSTTGNTAINAIDPLSDNENIQTEANALLDFSEDDPFHEGNY